MRISLNFQTEFKDGIILVSDSYNIITFSIIFIYIDKLYTYFGRTHI